MGKLKSFFFEQDAPEECAEPVYEESYGEIGELQEVNTEGVTDTNFVGDIYAKNEMMDFSRSIFKVEELIDSLPKEMPNETKKNTVCAILGSFGLTTDEVIGDGKNRAELLNAAYESIKTEKEGTIAQLKIQIEEKKKEIQEMEKVISECNATIKSTDEMAEAEIKRIVSLIEFIGGQK